MRPAILNTQDFIKEAQSAHGNRYDYRLVDFIGSEKKVKIVCLLHGMFEQLPHNHRRGVGCPKCGLITCANARRGNSLGFIEKAQKVHGTFYNYSLVEYVGNATKVKIVCSQHGEFLQSPASHLKGSRCPDCALVGRANKRRSSASVFEKKAKAVHGDRYDYSLIKYVNSKTKVTIICSTHGAFEQVPNGHLSGLGCFKCGHISKAKTKTKATSKFAEQACIKHNGKYTYELSVYKGVKSKLKITCPKHGVFEQTPDGHLQGRGCVECGLEIMSGKTHPAYNPKLTDEYREHRRNLQNAELKQWRGSVFGRDNGTCRKCQTVRTTKNSINAHHILPWSKFPEVRFDVDNGVTLCRTCHQKYHSLYKLDECNHKTIAEFLC